jgi:hypothetical protein
VQLPGTQAKQTNSAPEDAASNNLNTLKTALPATDSAFVLDFLPASDQI